MDELLDIFDLSMGSLIYILIIAIVIWIAIREVKLWYWRINDIVNEQRKQTKLLEEILDVLKEKHP